MSSFDLEEVYPLFDEMVESKFKGLLAVAYQSYSRRPTPAKLAYLVLNLPIGIFLSPNDLKDLYPKGRDNLPEGKALLADLIKDQRKLLTLMKMKLIDMKMGDVIEEWSK